ncbi:hypothetical protein Pyn_25405 [Prunus yedoensis var. nudiflora]|uniref:Uncharacterized protein n=1 Tax=Prunus yedoensis var. nudiflora TaxID=2094558 RepID=A0A314Y3Z4_PRUYE|nr:hypothetical protein Pyn_25405 [Prunus yedoensis var. nudiflora]
MAQEEEKKLAGYGEWLKVRLIYDDWRPSTLPTHRGVQWEASATGIVIQVIQIACVQQASTERWDDGDGSRFSQSNNQ